MLQLQTANKYSIFTCSWSDDRAKGYYNPPQILRYKDNETIIGAGTSDTIYLFKINQTDEVLVLTINLGLYYAGIELFDSKLAKIADAFLQSDWQIDEIGDLDELAPITVAKRLFEYL